MSKDPRFPDDVNTTLMLAKAYARRLTSLRIIVGLRAARMPSIKSSYPTFDNAPASPIRWALDRLDMPFDLQEQPL